MKAAPFLLRGLCAVALLVSLAACGGGNGNGGNSPKPPPVGTTPETQPTAPDPSAPDPDQPAPQLKCAP